MFDNQGGLFMTQGLKLATKQIQEQSPLERHWNDKLLGGTDENPFPLAPRDLVHKGIVTLEDYRRENELLDMFSNSIMEKELLEIRRETFFVDASKKVEVLGAGLGRGLRWIKPAVQTLDLHVVVRDCAEVALDKVHELFRELGISGKVDLCHGEVEEEWAHVKQLTLPFLPLITYAGQFIQVQDPLKKDRMMEHFALRLKEGMLVNPPFPRLYLVHARRKDNNAPSRWKTYYGIPEWGDSIPYEDEELLAPMKKILGSRCKLETLGTHQYFHQIYAFLKISVS